ncbi:putative beta-lysine N-acetyltransferase [Sphaerochaeta pleomorpha str. Grapes]|uniref:Putative beta-lysine N-acetyltransferase n=1 Tax=Sphaerochaeta pleomorpha (strain ATCC BAA-1885 / DSM 22778 / Grapes) TaxID=158190 RepID=G8QT55_SPHPG|nr:putative beta-lysine N-acetyltransferase [Sphaerochaeta pleomorpha]AEV27960.1 putative beta-lysine N-acetyltransferase [Sphaerochaeta pleomorpha str. Grapes]
MYDTTLALDGALVQHGENNSRVYMMDIREADPVFLIAHMNKLAVKHGYGKIFSKVPKSKSKAFLQAGFAVEALVNGLYGGTEKGLFLCKYFTSEREQELKIPEYNQVLSLAQAKNTSPLPPLGKGTRVRLCTVEDIPRMSLLYKQVFSSYPFPIDDPLFIESSLKGTTLFAGIEKKGNLVALASAECNFAKDHLHSEMTDFATLPSHRGNNYASHLLLFLEQEAQKKGIKTAFTIARAISKGMNITFSKAGYLYGGRLKNNTDISGNIESMNVWYKDLTAKAV